MWQRAKIIDPTNGDMRPLWLLGILIWVRVEKPFIVTDAIDFITQEIMRPLEVFSTNLLDDDNILNSSVVIRRENCELLGEFTENDDVEYISLQILRS